MNPAPFLYVDPQSGQNANPGTAAQPLQTLTQALARLQAAPGDRPPTLTIQLLPGHYTVA